MVFLYAAIVVIAILGYVVLCIKALESESFISLPSIAAIVVTIGFVALCFLESEKDYEKGLCVAYETKMYYNAGTKTMMPAKVCVLRGEWVRDK